MLLLYTAIKITLWSGSENVNKVKNSDATFIKDVADGALPHTIKLWEALPVLPESLLQKPSVIFSILELRFAEWSSLKPVSYTHHTHICAPLLLCYPYCYCQGQSYCRDVAGFWGKGTQG